MRFPLSECLVLFDGVLKADGGEDRGKGSRDTALVGKVGRATIRLQYGVRNFYVLCMDDHCVSNVLKTVEPFGLVQWRGTAGCEVLFGGEVLVADVWLLYPPLRCAGIDRYPPCFSTQPSADLTSLVMASFASGQDGFEGNETLRPTIHPCRHTTRVLTFLIPSFSRPLTPCNFANDLSPLSRHSCLTFLLLDFYPTTFGTASV
jgi:hypothetical protein